MEKQKINSSLLEDNSNGFRSLSEIDERNQKRKINLIITEEGSRFHIRGVGDGLDAFENWEDDIPLSKQELWAAVQKCRQAWQTAVKSSENGGFTGWSQTNSGTPWSNPAQPRLSRFSSIRDDILPHRCPEIPRIG
jgi:hypothetical protein